MNRPYISFCIPTYERVNELQETINNILNQNVDVNCFEICISDDSVSNSIKDIMQKYKDHSNIIYQKIEPCAAFENVTNALKMGKGYLLKLIDDHCKITEEGLKVLIESVKENIKEKPQLFYLNGNPEKRIAEGMDEFLVDVGIQVTHARDFALWKEDFDYILKEKIDLNPMFPHVSMLFNCTYKCQFLLYRNDFFKEIHLKKKGGYNLYEAFGYQFIGLVKKIYLENQISKDTYIKMKYSALRFLADFDLIVRTQSEYQFTINKSVYYLGYNYNVKEMIYFLYILNRDKYCNYKKKKYYSKTIPLSEREFEKVTEKYVVENKMKLQKRNVWVYGAGKGGEIVYDVLNQNDIMVQGFFDKKGDEIKEKYGLKVLKPSKDNMKNKYIIISLRAFEDTVYETFKKLQIPKKKYIYLVLENNT